MIFTLKSNDCTENYFLCYTFVVSKNDVETSKLAFVSSATAFEEWTTMTGLVEQLKGL